MITLDFRQRIGLLVIGMVCGFLLLAGRLVEIQILEHDQWLAAARTPNAGWAPLVARRGRILDADGLMLSGDDIAYDLVLYASAWHGRLHECDYCAFHRYVKPNQKVPKCPRCKARPFAETEGRTKRGLRFVDRRELTKLASALKMRRTDLLKLCWDEFKRVEKSVNKQLGKLAVERKTADVRNVWADKGWRPRVIVRGVPYEVARLVELYPHRYPAFGILTVNARQCLVGPPFAHLVGIAKREGERANRPGGGLQWVSRARGVSGVERLLNRELTGMVGWKQMRRRHGRMTDEETDRQAPLHGLDVQLTMRRQDQAMAYDALHKARGAFVVVNADTGAVLAMATAPSFEPRDYNTVLQYWVERQHRADAAAKKGDRIPRRQVSRLTPLVERSCSPTIPGSILKPFTALAGLHAELISPSRVIACNKVFHNSHGRVIRGRMTCHKAHGPLDLHRSLTESCNVYYQTILREFIESRHEEDFLALGRMFGFGEPTGLPPENARRAAAGWNFDKSGWGEKVTAAIGQGRVQLSPAQMARAYAGLATGRLPKLFAVAQVGPRRTEPVTRPIPLPAHLLTLVRKALLDVPRIGTAHGWSLEAHGIGCKTGTAQVQSSRNGRLYNSWIAGFAPARANRPRIAFAMVIRDTDLPSADACGPRLRDFFARFYGGE